MGVACPISARPGHRLLVVVGRHRQERSTAQVADIAKGGYILKDCDGQPEFVLIATGSEVQLAVEAADTLSAQGKAVRVVSMPSTDVFERQDAAYKELVLPVSVTKRIAIEAGIRDYWYKFVGLQGGVIGMDTFGESAPAGDLFEHFGITKQAVVELAASL